MWGFERFGHNGVQTNGSLISDAHLELFKRYRVQVGISIDGPGALNDTRWAGTLARTREATARTEAAIERLCREGMPPSLIVTLHRGNATGAMLPVLHDWFRHLERLGVTVGPAPHPRGRIRGDPAAIRAHDRREPGRLPELRRPRARAVDTQVRRLHRHAEPAPRARTTQRPVSGAPAIPIRPAPCAAWRATARVELRSHLQGRHRVRQGRATGVRAVPRPLPHAARARRVPWLPVLPDVQGRVPGHGDRRGLAQPHRGTAMSGWASSSTWRSEMVLAGEVAPVGESPSEPSSRPGCSPLGSGAERPRIAGVLRQLDEAATGGAGGRRRTCTAITTETTRSTG